MANEHMIDNPGFKKDDIGYKQILMFRLNDASMVMANVAEYGVYTFARHVKGLDAMLTPYWDKTYRAQMKELDKVKLPPIDTRGMTKLDAENFTKSMRDERMLEHMMAWFKCIMLLVDRLGLMLETQTEEAISNERVEDTEQRKGEAVEE